MYQLFKVKENLFADTAIENIFKKRVSLLEEFPFLA